MAKPKVEVTVRWARDSIAYLSRYRKECRTLQARYQVFIGEMIFLRLFSVLEIAVEEIACKLISGANYTSGRAPNLLFSANSVQGARNCISTHKRKRPLTYPKWNQEYQIKKNVKFLIDAKDPYVQKATIHGTALNEMRIVRNHLAHRNSGTAVLYRKVIQAAYGGHTRIAPGPFLMSEKRTPTAKIDQYFANVTVIIDDLSGG